MGLSQKLLALLVLGCALSAQDREHISYLMQSSEIRPALELYENYKKELGRHDFEILQRLGMILLQQGIRSSDLETQLLSLYGASIAGLTSTVDILEEGVRSVNPETQMASVQFLARMHDDRCDELLTKAMSSPFLLIRMEAGYHLAARKHRKAAGQIEALMHRMPSELRFYFPQFFALIGTPDAMGVLKHLIEDPLSSVRVEAILNAARYRRDDLLPKIRAHATHPHLDEQEASAAALGILKDSKSIAQLKRLSEAPALQVSLAACRALFLLGDASAVRKIDAAASNKDLFAIALLAEFPGSEPVLVPLLKDENLSVRINAAISLLRLRDARALPVIEEILLRDMRDLGFYPTFSQGRSLMAWKVVPSLANHVNKDMPVDLHSISLELREQLLVECLELSQNDFLHIAHRIFDTRQLDLVPLLVSLLENHQSEPALRLLKQKAEMAGSPQIRAYCNLSLYRLHEKGPFEETLRTWLTQAGSSQMIRFRPTLPFHARTKDSIYELTPEETSRLLIEAYQALSDRHDEKSIEILLDAIKEGNPKNRFTLAGLLIRALQ